MYVFTFQRKYESGIEVVLLMLSEKKRVSHSTDKHRPLLCLWACPVPSRSCVHLWQAAMCVHVMGCS